MPEWKKASSLFDRYFPNITPGVNIPEKEGVYRVPLAGSIIRDAAPRDAVFEWILDMGISVIDAVFNGTPIVRTPGEILHLVFPERWMSCGEQRYFITAMCQHPQARDIGGVYIITSSPILVGEIYGPVVVIETPGRTDWLDRMRGLPAAKDDWSKTNG
jgi:hypothetical protein